MTSTGEDVVTHDGIGRQYRLCWCSVCKTEQRCVPTNDFYEMSADVAAALQLPRGYDPRGLVCSGCYRKSLQVRFPHANISDPNI